MTFKIKKVMKKALGLMMALAMVLPICLGTSVSHAAEEPTTSLVVKNPVEGKTYELYKMFDATVDGKEENAKISYSITEEWRDFFENGKGSNYINDDFVVDAPTIELGGSTKYFTITEENISEFAGVVVEYISSHVEELTPTATKEAQEGDTLTFDGLKLGYYVLLPKGASVPGGEHGTVISLVNAGAFSEVEAKGTWPTVEKEADAEDVEIGQTVNYTLTGVVPDTTGFTKYKYILKDTLTEGLTLNPDVSDVKVTIDGKDLVGNHTVSIEGNVLTVTFEMMKLQAQVGKEIKVVYSAKVNENAISGKQDNKVVLEYSHEPGGDTETTETNDPVFDALIKVLKTDGKDGKALGGAEFVLKNSEGKYYKISEAGDKVSWVDNEDDATKLVTDDTTGIAQFVGLKSGTYELVETKAPAGYNKVEKIDPIIINVNRVGDELDEAIIKRSIKEVPVENNAGSQLPGTGGVGTTLFMIIGGGTILFALYSLKKDKIKEEKDC